MGWQSMPKSRVSDWRRVVYLIKETAGLFRDIFLCCAVLIVLRVFFSANNFSKEERNDG